MTDVYSRLREHLDSFILGAPAADAILNILRIRFTPEEAELALLLGARPKDVSSLAKRCDKNEESLRSLLQRMAEKALVLTESQPANGETKEVYSLLPTAVGLWETSFAKGERSPRTEQLARYWREYWKSGWGKQMHGSDTPFCRVIPVAQSIAPEQEVYSYERASELIKGQDYACVLHCPCRKSAELDGKGCGKPTEVCVHFGHLARFFVAKGYAREVKQKQVLEILDITEKAGLVHMVGNSQEMGVAMCSCCTCCCTQLRAISEMQKPNAVAASRFFAEVDQDTCIACGACNDRCQVHAISQLDTGARQGVATASKDDCIGCGLCVTSCPVEAISLKERTLFQKPLATGLELARSYIQGRSQ